MVGALVPQDGTTEPPGCWRVAERKLLIAANGQPRPASTAARFRKAPHACIRRAVDLEILAVDPWPPRPRGRSQRKAARTQGVGPSPAP